MVIRSDGDRCPCKVPRRCRSSSPKRNLCWAGTLPCLLISMARRSRRRYGSCSEYDCDYDTVARIVATATAATTITTIKRSYYYGDDDLGADLVRVGTYESISFILFSLRIALRLGGYFYFYYDGCLCRHGHRPPLPSSRQLVGAHVQADVERHAKGISADCQEQGHAEGSGNITTCRKYDDTSKHAFVSSCLPGPQEGREPQPPAGSITTTAV